MIAPDLHWGDDPTLVETLARASGLARPLDADTATASPAASQLGVEAHPVRVTYDQLPDLVRGGGPALLTVFSTDGGPATRLALLGPAGPLGRVRLLAPDGRRVRVRVRVRVRDVLQTLRAPVERHTRGGLEPLLDAAGLTGRPRERAARELLARRLHGQPMGGGVLLRAAPWGTPWAQASEARGLGPMAAGVALRLLATTLSVLGWVLVGGGALGGHLGPGWVVGWSLLMLTGAVLGQLSRWMQGRMAIRGGAWIKASLLRGALAVDPQTYRTDGVGGLLARTHESQAIEDLVLFGGLAALFALVDLAAGGWMLTHAPGGAVLGALFATALVAVALGAWRALDLRGRWTDHRRRLTHLLVERMTGHRTRLAQAQPARWFAGEDEALAAYHDASLRHDTHEVWVGAAISQGFYLAGLAVLCAAFVAGPLSTTALAIGVGTLLWLQRSLGDVTGQLSGLVSAAIAWREVGPLLQGAWTEPPAPRRDLAATARRAVRQAPDRSRPAPAGPDEARTASPSAAPPADRPAASGVPRGPVLLRARDLTFAWPDRPPILDGVDLTLHEGDRVLLTGASGSGKSTLAKLLTGTHTPTGGVVLLRGLDAETLGPAGWRAHAVAAPQFHDNHLFEQSLSFNLLLGRTWPPSKADLDEAEALLRALGLGELLERMPAGMGQPVGASGWQLSHGERSRVFLARALLQGAELVVLDESFAALDPVTLARCLAVAEERATTLVLIAHP